MDDALISDDLSELTAILNFNFTKASQNFAKALKTHLVSCSEISEADLVASLTTISSLSKDMGPDGSWEGCTLSLVSSDIFDAEQMDSFRSSTNQLFHIISKN